MEVRLHGNKEKVGFKHRQRMPLKYTISQDGTVDDTAPSRALFMALSRREGPLHVRKEKMRNEEQHISTSRPAPPAASSFLLNGLKDSSFDTKSIGIDVKLPNVKPQSDEQIILRGGLSHNGRPAELFRLKDGKEIPLNGEPFGSPSTKSTLSYDEMDDAIVRSMTRRRRSAKLGDVFHTCRDCFKVFKRPCDLTKHEITHSRPWKCTEEKCKYFELGWPTEKERDRHVHDKHILGRLEYHCLFFPCTYASKRESNCKQHMEKAHGWEYVRTKTNGRIKPNYTSQHHFVHASDEDSEGIDDTAGIMKNFVDDTNLKSTATDSFSEQSPTEPASFSEKGKDWIFGSTKSRRRKQKWANRGGILKQTLASKPKKMNFNYTISSDCTAQTKAQQRAFCLIALGGDSCKRASKGMYIKVS